jgi:8-amino-7-oxononanoate synthase
VLKAVGDGLKRFGLNVAASRLTTGHHKIYDHLEGELAKFFQTEDALLVSNGYLTGIVVAQALAGTYSDALLDARVHPALLDAADQLNCPILKFGHRDADDFASAIKRCGKGARPIVLTDGMFSHDGSVALLKSYLEHLPADGMILVDDAHGAGVLGKSGGGAPEHEGVSRRQIIQCITLSKAFGVFGGAVLGTKEIREKIFQRSRSFIGSTPLPLPMANAALASLKIVRSRGSALRRRLFENAKFVKDGLEQTGFAVPHMPGPIVPIRAPSERESLGLKKHLLGAGIFPPFLKYPGGDANGYFRFVISSEHTRADLDTMVNALKKF